MKKIIFDFIQICLRYKSNELFTIDTINEDKLITIRNEYKISKDEAIAIIFDNTIFGDAKNGWAICESGIFYSNPWFVGKEVGYISWEELCNYNFDNIDFYTIEIGKKHRLYCINHSKLAMKLIEEIKDYVKKNYLDYKKEYLPPTVENEENDKEVDVLNKSIYTAYIDINSAAIDEIILLPYFTCERAELIIKYRDKRLGFRSVDEIEELLKLKPHEVEKIREQIVMSPYRPIEERRIIDF